MLSHRFHREKKERSAPNLCTVDLGEKCMNIVIVLDVIF